MLKYYLYLFVTKPFNNWKKLKEKAKAHESASRSFKKNLHKDSVLNLGGVKELIRYFLVRSLPRTLLLGCPFMDLYDAVPRIRTG